MTPRQSRAARLLVGLVLGGVFLCVGQVRAQDPDAVAAFRARVDAAAVLIESDLPEAVNALSKLAAESVESRRVRPLAEAERPAHRLLFVLLGRAHVQLLDNERATDSFRELLRIDPLFAGQLTPREQELVSAIKQAEMGAVDVTCRERGVRVLLDGLDAGMTGEVPLRLSLMAGTYELRLEKRAFTTATARAVVSAGQTAVVDVTPSRRIPPMVFLTDREGVDVEVDGQPLGRTLALAELQRQATPDESSAVARVLAASGLGEGSGGVLLRQQPIDRPVTVRFRRACHVEQSRVVSLTTEALDGPLVDNPVVWFGEVSVVRMLPDSGVLRVESIPTGADIWLDGEPVGRTPFERSVCAAAHQVRVRYALGASTASASVVRGRVESVAVALKPNLVFMGAVDATRGPPVVAPDLTRLVRRAFGGSMGSYRLVQAGDWAGESAGGAAAAGDVALVELVRATDLDDRGALARVLPQVAERFDTPLVLAAVQRAAGATGETPVEFLLFWREHTTVDRVVATGVTDSALADAVKRLEMPAGPDASVWGAAVGIRTADTLLPGAARVIVAVDADPVVAASGARVGDGVLAVDGTSMAEVRFSAAVARLQPGATLSAQLTDDAGASREVVLPVVRVPMLARVFDSRIPVNAMIAALSHAVLTLSGVDRDLATFSLAAANIRVRAWTRAGALLDSLGDLPKGTNVGPGTRRYFRGRCHEEAGERDLAVAAYSDALAASDEYLLDGSVSVSTLARARLAVLERQD